MPNHFPVVARLACVVYWTILTFGLLWPGVGDVSLTNLGVRLGNRADLLHCLAFMLLTLLVRWARWPWRPRWAITTLVLYGVGTELAQAPIPGRYASVLDVAANLLGILLGLTVGRWLSSLPLMGRVREG